MQYIFVVLGILILLLLLSIVYTKKKGKKPTDYHQMFIIGLVWTIIGLPLENHSLAGIGIVFLIAGLVHRDKWEKNKKDRKKGKMNDQMTIASAIILGLLFLSAIVIYTYLRANHG